MRQDQFESLQKRAEQLVDLFLDESDPTSWPGAGLKPNAMDKQARGDRYWCKKDAAATLACASRIAHLIDLVRAKTAGGEATPGAVTEGEDELEAEIVAAESEAAKLTDRVLKRAQGRNAKP